jgi:predicted dehydrogenase
VSVRVALVGCGAWGRNLLRVLLADPAAVVVAVADPSPARRAVAAALSPGAAVVPSLDEAVGCGVDAALIATPPHTHAALVLRALGAGVDVFVEKPLATRVTDAERCAGLAAALGRVAMVGHLLRYHPAVERLLKLAADGALGRLIALESARLSIDGDRSASAAWTLGPHDFSVLHALDPSPVHRLAARSGPDGDPVRIEAELQSGLAASIVLSRVGGVKERRLRVVGSTATAVFDDVRAPDRLLVGPVEIEVPFREPLAVEIAHFLRCVERRATPRTPFAEGVTVVRALSQVEESWALPGPAEAPGSPASPASPTAPTPERAAPGPHS